jgi:hypothetical protein
MVVIAQTPNLVKITASGPLTAEAVDAGRCGVAAWFRC